MTEIKIVWEGKEEIIKLQPLNWGQENECIRKSIITMKVNGKQVKDFDTILQRELMLLYSIAEAPFEKTLDNLRKVSKQEGAELWKECSALNNVDTEEAG